MGPAARATDLRADERAETYPPVWWPVPHRVRSWAVSGKETEQCQYTVLTIQDMSKLDDAKSRKLLSVHNNINPRIV